MDNYIQLLEKIARSSGLAKEEIERKVEAKRAKLSGLVSKEGAAQIVAAELGINFDKEKLKISELVDGMKRANILGKIIQLSPVREYNKNGRTGKVANLVVADESSNVKTVLWDTHHIALIEQGQLSIGDVVEISNGNVRNNELHLSSFGDIKKSNENLGEVVVKKSVSMKSLKDAKSGESIGTRALIVKVSDPRYFEVCPECRKKVSEGECKVHGKVQGQKRALLNVELDDGSETIRAVLFGDQINKLGLTNEEIFSFGKITEKNHLLLELTDEEVSLSKRFLEKKSEFLGEEKLFTGNVRKSNYTDKNGEYNEYLELNVENIEEVNAQELIKELEAKMSA